MVGDLEPEYEPNYFGVQGIQGWEDPPILDNPTETKTINGREYVIYTDSGKIKLVAWHRGENTYWISNSLQQSLTNEQMMGIAEFGHVILPKKKAAKHGEQRRMSEEREAGRGDRSRLGRAGHRRLLRRARPPGDRPRHPPGEGRGALARRGRRSTSRA